MARLRIVMRMLEFLLSRCGAAAEGGRVRFDATLRGEKSIDVKMESKSLRPWGDIKVWICLFKLLLLF